MDTTERLCAVADFIEINPKRYCQEVWGASEPLDVAGLGECHTVACIAGWAVALTPVDEVVRVDWTRQGAISLGLADDLACTIFDEDWEPANVPEVLRVLAKIPKGERTLRRAQDELAALGIDGDL